MLELGYNIILLIKATLRIVVLLGLVLSLNFLREEHALQTEMINTKKYANHPQKDRFGNPKSPLSTVWICLIFYLKYISL